MYILKLIIKYTINFQNLLQSNDPKKIKIDNIHLYNFDPNDIILQDSFNNYLLLKEKKSLSLEEYKKYINKPLFTAEYQINNIINWDLCPIHILLIIRKYYIEIKTYNKIFNISKKNTYFISSSNKLLIIF